MDAAKRRRDEEEEGGAVAAGGPAKRQSSGRSRAAPRGCPNDGKKRVCLAASGSVAAVKVPQLVEQLLETGAYVDLVLTRAAAFFQASRRPPRGPPRGPPPPPVQPISACRAGGQVRGRGTRSAPGAP